MDKVELYINGKTMTGVSLSDTGLSALMTPPPMKEYIEDESRAEHGKRVIVEDAKMDSRQLSLPIHIVASNHKELLSRYNTLCTELAKGKIDISTSYNSGVVYKCLYKSCVQFSLFVGGMAHFMLKLEEPNPDDRAPSEE